MACLLRRIGQVPGCARVANFRASASGVAGGVVTFGRYRGAQWQDVLEKDPGYCRWIIREAQPDRAPSLSLVEFADWLKDADPEMASFAKREWHVGQSQSQSSSRPIPPSDADEDDDEQGLGSKVLTFGKHRGRTFREVLYEDPKYCSWAMKNYESTLETMTPDLLVFLEWVKERWDRKGPVLHFGKHKGCHLSDVLEKDPSYLTWLLARNEQKKSEPQEESEAGLRLALESYCRWIQEHWDVPPYLTKGRFAGVSFEQVFKDSPDYCRWVLSRPDLHEDDNHLKDFATWLANHEEREKLNSPHLTTGKYRGVSFEDILEKDKNYCRWALKSYSKDIPCALQEFALWLQEHAPELEEDEQTKLDPKRFEPKRFTWKRK
mmetsp:Transcript_9993/g.21989  ORF Transcript_9993/g.21989 Transcript_9993/m.21989 type:complete len:378 (+) Transcript_9993:77-1210(+)|eukprot:CAMPEP_0206449722 /NCGR_PEP_ID=MMETSP0324_2-20121206/18274_1 /ASSEMBLY_ACC=CAM_ASM_000836 /TAXON_ID=2866 /ORGANISM="Crypthecodinium cohnii, Strain Seligo" /LENGTH=377 /DNA_ID=CAMNT_0053919185 /DNA_START=76 /DNA_END=1209 /DNA_ORIENTATION=-